MINLTDYHLHLVLCPVDMRRGFRSLSALAGIALGVDVYDGHDCVIFVSKSRGVCKVIWCDDTGAMLLSRKLTHGRFARMLARAEDGSALCISSDELKVFFSGQPIQWVPKSIV